MRKVLLGSASVVGAGLLAAATFAGCAAGDVPADVSQGVEATEAAPVGAKLPNATASGTMDAGKDAARVEAGKDAGPPPAQPGEACSKVDAIFTRSCGACGTQSALCFAEDGGAGVVSDYGPCSGEVLNGCLAGATEDVACGNCGTIKRTCDSTCKWSASACAEPPAACKAGTSEHTTTGCPTVNTYRRRSCGPTCGWSSFTPCLAPMNETVVDVNAVAAQASTVPVSLTDAQLGKGLPYGHACPAPKLALVDHPYAYIEIRNTTGKKATVTVTTSLAPGNPSLSTQLAGYKVPFVPADDAARLQCTTGGYTSLNNFVLEAGASSLVYVQSYYAYNAASPAQSTGMVNLNVRTVSLL